MYLVGSSIRTPILQLVKRRQVRQENSRLSSTYRPEMALGPAAIPSVKLVDSAASEGTAGEHWRECGPAEDGEMPGYRRGQS